MSPRVTRASRASPPAPRAGGWGFTEQGERVPSLGPSRRTERKTASQVRRRHLDVIQARRLNCSKRSRSSAQMREAVVLDSFPSPARSHSDSMSRIDRPLTNTPITIAAAARCATRSCCTKTTSRRTARRPGGPAVSRPRGSPRASAPCAHEAVAQPALVVPQRALMRQAALIARAAQPRVELVLHGALDDQPGPEPGQLRQRLARVLADPDGEQLIDLLLDLRRRRYGTSHCVGPSSSSCRT